jgi:putative membrane protein
MERGRSDEVRDYGRRLLEDHGRSDEQVTSLAQEKGITLFHPEPRTDDQREMEEENHRMVHELEEAHGERFDRLFAQAMARGHDQDIHLLERSLDRIEDPAIRRLVTDTLPVLKEHHQIAERIEHRDGTPDEDMNRP